MSGRERAGDRRRPEDIARGRRAEHVAEAAGERAGERRDGGERARAERQAGAGAAGKRGGRAVLGHRGRLWPAGWARPTGNPRGRAPWSAAAELRERAAAAGARARDRDG